MVRRVRVEGHTIVRSAAKFGFSRPSFREAVAVLDGGGLPALVPVRDGPRRARLTARSLMEARLLVSNRESGDLLTVVEILELCWGNVVKLGVKALVVPPADPSRGRDLEVGPTAPRPL